MKSLNRLVLTIDRGVLKTGHGVNKKMALDSYVRGFMDGVDSHKKLYSEWGIGTIVFCHGDVKIVRKIKFGSQRSK